MPTPELDKERLDANKAVDSSLIEESDRQVDELKQLGFAPKGSYRLDHPLDTKPEQNSQQQRSRITSQRF